MGLLAATGAFGSYPQRRLDSCFFGHKSPEGRLSLFLFGGMKIVRDTKHECVQSLPTLHFKRGPVKGA